MSKVNYRSGIPKNYSAQKRAVKKAFNHRNVDIFASLHVKEGGARRAQPPVYKDHQWQFKSLTGGAKFSGKFLRAVLNL